MSILSRVGQRVAQALLGQDCLLCAGQSGEKALCEGCSASLPALPGPGCPTCALPTPAGELCGRCLADPPAFDSTVAPFAYAFPVDVLIQGLKYRSRLALAPYFAAAMSRAAIDRPDRILPVPLHPERLRERGFNQALEIARPLARAWGVGVDWRSCSRILDAPPQAQLAWSERHRNVRAAFACDARLDGERVVVVDDVMTTGATLDELAGTLKRAGAARVINCVVARTLPP